MAPTIFFLSGNLRISDRYIVRSQRTIPISEVMGVAYVHNYSHLATQKTANMIFSLTVLVAPAYALWGRALLVWMVGSITFLSGLGLMLLACGLVAYSYFLTAYYARRAQLQRQNEISVSIRMRDGNLVPIETMPVGYGEEARQLVKAVYDAMASQAGPRIQV